VNVNRLIVILFINFILISVVYGQQIFKWKMDVREVAVDGVFNTHDTLVFWGKYGDTICFRFNASLKCFCQISKNTKEAYSNKLINNSLLWINRENSSTNSHQSESRYFLYEDVFCELYVIRFIYTSTGVSIFVVNLFGIPNYIFMYPSVSENLR
jgi:hypothetical protein